MRADRRSRPVSLWQATATAVCCLALAGVLVAAPSGSAGAAPTGITGVKFLPGTQLGGGHPVSWIVDFTTGSSGALAAGSGTITITAPGSTVLPGAASAYSVGAGRVSVVDGGGGTNSVTITTPLAVGASQRVQVQIAEVTNPVGGSYPSTAFSVATSADPTPVNPSVAIPFGSVVSGVAVTPVSLVPGATTSWDVTFTTSAGGALPVGDGIAVNAPSGTEFPTSAADYTVNGTTAAGVLPNGVPNSVSITLAAAIGESSSVTITVNGVVNPPAGHYFRTDFEVDTSVDAAGVPVQGLTFASGVTSVSVSPSDRQGGAQASWQVGFTTSSSGALSPGTSQVTVTAPTTTTFPGLAADYSVNGAKVTAAPAVASGTVTLTVPDAAPSVGSSSAVSIVVSGVTNPAAGTYADTAFSVATSADVPPTSPTAGIDFGSAVTSVTLSPSSYAAGGRTSWGVGFRTSPTGALASGDTITISAPAGTTFPSAAADYAVDGVTVTATPVVGNGTVTIATPVDVAQASAGSVSITGVTNPPAGDYPAGQFSVATVADAAGVDQGIPFTFSGSVTSVILSPSSRQGGARASWDVGFTTSSSGALTAGSGQITITGPGSTAFPPSAADYTVDGVEVTDLPTRGAGTVTVTVPSGATSIGGSSAVSVVVSGVTNPAGGVYPAGDFSVSTSADTVFVGPASEIAFGSGVTAVRVSPSSLLPAANAVWTVAFETSASGALGVGDAITIAAPPGTTFPPAAGDYAVDGTTVHSAPTVGLGVVRIVTPVAIGSSTAVSIVITGVGNPGAGAFSSATFSVATTADAAAYPTSGLTFAVAGRNPPPGTPAGPVPMTTAGAAGTATPLPIRIYGPDAIGTSIAASRAAYPTSGSAKAVVLARSGYFSDALAGGPLAAQVGGPLLVTPGARSLAGLDPRVEAEIERVLEVGGTVYILGGDLALSSSIDTTLRTLGYVTKRIAGPNEFATAVAIAQQLGNPSTIFEASGLDFPDALSAVPAAVSAHGAILLTDGATQAPETAAYLAAHPNDTRYAIGGPLAAAGADPTATAVYGQDRYATSAAVAAAFFPGATTFGAASGASYPDALSGGVFMAVDGRLGPLLLVEPSLPLPPRIAAYLATLRSGAQGYLFGGPKAVADGVAAALQAAVG